SANLLDISRYIRDFRRYFDRKLRFARLLQFICVGFGCISKRLHAACFYKYGGGNYFRGGSKHLCRGSVHERCVSIRFLLGSKHKLVGSKPLPRRSVYKRRVRKWFLLGSKP